MYILKIYIYNSGFFSGLGLDINYAIDGQQTSEKTGKALQFPISSLFTFPAASLNINMN